MAMIGYSILGAIYAACLFFVIYSIIAFRRHNLVNGVLSGIIPIVTIIGLAINGWLW